MLCLIITCYRLKLLDLDARDNAKRASDGNLFYSEHRIGNLLQTCASLALGGYIRGDVVSFGYPRPDGSGFLQAHRETWRRFGAYEPVSEVPTGMPDSENDAGIDLIEVAEFR